MRLPLFHALVFLAALVAVARGQQRTAMELHSYNAGPAPQEFVAGWYDLKSTYPVNDAGKTCPTLENVISLVPPQKSLFHKYGADLLLWGHEEVHTVHEVASNALGTGVRAYYVGPNKLYAIRSIPIDKRLIEQAVPQALRGRWWNGYMAGQNPGMPDVILDEWFAYIASAEMTNQLYDKEHEYIKEQTPNQQGGYDYTKAELIDREAAVEFAGYAITLLECVDRYVPQYPDRAALRELVDYGIRKTMQVQVNTVSTAYQQYFRRYSNCSDGSCETTVVQQQPRTTTQTVASAPGAVQGLQPLPPRPTAQLTASSPCKCATDGCGCDGKYGKVIASLQSEIASLKSQVTEIASHPEKFKGKDGVSPDIGEVAAKAAEMILPEATRVASEQAAQITIPQVNKYVTNLAETVSNQTLDKVKRLPIEFQHVDSKNNVVGEPVRAYLGGSVAFRHFRE